MCENSADFTRCAMLKHSRDISEICLPIEGTLNSHRRIFGWRLRRNEHFLVLKFVMKKFSNKTTRLKGRTRTMFAMANWNRTSLAVYAENKKPNAWNVESNWVIFLAFSLCCRLSPCVRTTACMYKYRFGFGMHLCSRQIWLHHTSDGGAAAAVPAIAWQSTTGFLPFSRELKHRRSRDDADDDNDHCQHEEQKLPLFFHRRQDYYEFNLSFCFFPIISNWQRHLLFRLALPMLPSLVMRDSVHLFAKFSWLCGDYEFI